MRHYYALAAAMLLTSGLMAQSNQNRGLVAPAEETHYGTPVMGATMDRNGGDIVFQEDFALGLAGNNGIGPWTVGGPDGAIWRKVTGSPVGAYIGTNPVTQRIQSATVTNGYMIFNGDSANCTWNGTTPTALPSAQFTDWEGSLESPALNLSATPKVVVKWQQRFRFCCGDAPHFFEVSTDGGSSWPHSFDLNPFWPLNTLSPTQNMAVNITDAIAGNNTNVKFRFRHNSEAGSSHYHWQIDDVAVVEAYNVDARLNYAYVSHTSDAHEYGRIPANQFSSTVLMGGEVENFGQDDWASSSLTVAATLAGSPVLNETINGGPVAAADSALAEAEVNAPTGGPAAGVYQCIFDAVAPDADEDASNNQKQRNFEVNNLTYSLDGIGVHPTAAQLTTSAGSNSFANNTSGLTVMTFYRVSQTIGLNSIEMRIAASPQSQAGGYVIGMLLDSTGVLAAGSTLPVPLLISDAVDITAAMVSSGTVTIPLTTGGAYTLPPGDYYAAVTLSGTDGSTDRPIQVLDDVTVPQPGWASAIHLANSPGGGAAARTYSNGNAFAIRLKLTSITGIDEASDMGTSLYPNPTTGLLTFNDGKAGKREVTVFDAVGNVVATTYGQGPLQLDLSAFADGVYAVRITSAGLARTERVVLTR